MARASLAASAAAIAAAALTTSVLADVPSQLHVAIAGSDGLRVAWFTNATAPSVCSWGTSPSALTSTATGASPVNYFPDGG
jgi:hypothetical protein